MIELSAKKPKDLLIPWLRRIDPYSGIYLSPHLYNFVKEEADVNLQLCFLPSETWIEICLNLDLFSLVAFSQTCKRFNNISKSDIIWKNIYYFLTHEKEKIHLFRANIKKGCLLLEKAKLSDLFPHCYEFKDKELDLIVWKCQKEEHYVDPNPRFRPKEIIDYKSVCIWRIWKLEIARGRNLRKRYENNPNTEKQDQKIMNYQANIKKIFEPFIRNLISKIN